MDISHTEQMSLSIRWANDMYQIFEDILALAELPNTKAKVFYLYHNVEDKPMTVQVYTMSGIRNGVQALFKHEEGMALYVQCLAHKENAKF